MTGRARRSRRDRERRRTRGRGGGDTARARQGGRKRETARAGRKDGVLRSPAHDTNLPYPSDRLECEKDVPDANPRVIARRQPQKDSCDDMADRTDVGM